MTRFGYATTSVTEDDSGVNPINNADHYSNLRSFILAYEDDEDVDDDEDEEDEEEHHQQVDEIVDLEHENVIIATSSSSPVSFPNPFVHENYLGNSPF